MICCGTMAGTMACCRCPNNYWQPRHYEWHPQIYGPASFPAPKPDYSGLDEELKKLIEDYTKKKAENTQGLQVSK